MKKIFYPVILFVIAIVIIGTGAAIGHMAISKIVQIFSLQHWIMISIVAFAAVYLSMRRVLSETDEEPCIADEEPCKDESES